jgi:hypothetical protein
LIDFFFAQSFQTFLIAKRSSKGAKKIRAELLLGFDFGIELEFNSFFVLAKLLSVLKKA